MGGPAVAGVDTRAVDYTSDTSGAIASSAMELAWCGDRPLLAVGGRKDAVLVYRYRTFECVLELSATLCTFQDGTPPRSLAWAPGIGALLAAYREEWQFWLMEKEE